MVGVKSLVLETDWSAFRRVNVIGCKDSFKVRKQSVSIRIIINIVNQICVVFVRAQSLFLLFCRGREVS